MISPVSMPKVVVFPEPFTPSSVKHSPYLMPKEILSIATRGFQQIPRIYTLRRS